MDQPEPAAGPVERHAQHWVWLLTAALATLAGCLIVPRMLDDPAAAVPDLAWLALVPVFALAEVVVIHLPTQRNAHGHTLRELPAVLGLTFLAPQQYATAYVVGAGLALVVAARMRGVKLAFNTAMFAFEAALGSLVYHAVLHGGDPLSWAGWAAVLLAVLATDLVSAAAVTAAISLTEGAFDDEVLREALRSGVVAAFINTCVALLVATLVIVQPTALPLLGVVVVLLTVGYRVYITLARGHARTQLLYRFVERTSAAGSSDDVIAAVLDEAAALMHAERAYLVERLDATGELRHHTVVDATLHTETSPAPPATPWWWPAYGGRVVRHQPPAEDAHGVDDAATAPLSELTAARDGLAGPLREAGATRYVLVVCDRSFDKESFGDEDVQVFEALTVHAGVALERARTVSDLERLAEVRSHEARHDPLSGLLNRRAFNDAVAQTLHAPGAAGVVLLLDLDDFKDVNDTLGHSAGDQIISATARRLDQEAMGLVARLGGDEFAVLLPGLSLEEALAHARRLHGVLSQPVPLDEVQLTVSASIGVAQYHALTESAEDLLAQADVAMYSAKAERSGVAPYHPEAGDSTARRMTLAADLPAAIESGAVAPHFQPQADTATGVITGFEALVRWKHPVFGAVSPPEIVAVAHRTGHLRALTDAVLRRALAARREWSAAGHALSVSVNVTTRDISDPTLVRRVQQALVETGTPADSLVIEVTESDTMKDPERSLQILNDLHDLGVELSVDDFGTGYSSLAYIDQLPVTEVKIDRSFVVRLEREGADATIVRATIGLAHDLGLRVVAEGVETEFARSLVEALGGDVYQGFGLSRPMPNEEVLTWLDRHRGATLDTARPAWPVVRQIVPAHRA